MVRQATQSLLQFLTVLVAQLMALATRTGGPPTSLADLYLPVLIALAAALAIYGGAQLPIGGTESEVKIAAKQAGVGGS